jgi:beta-lactamase superfamily II metal-dependent hydrolase
MEVHFIDVGQGDAILVDYGTVEVLIDGGDRSPGVVPYLKKYVDGDLEAMVATHPHADHIGGLITVLQPFQVDHIYWNGETSTSQTYSDFMAQAGAEPGASLQQVRRGDTINVSGLVFSVFNPSGSLSTDTNDNSIVLKLKYGNTQFLFGGDAQQEAEASMLAAGLNVDSDILKVGHHGSRSSSSMPFLQAVSPQIAI